MSIWNPWHGCHRKSPGCAHCYMFRRDAEFDRDSELVQRTASYRLPMQRLRTGEYRLRPEDGPVYSCMTSDFFIEEADAWRTEAWTMIRARRELHFVIITKRIERFEVGLPLDWGDGYENVTICATCENQRMADERLPILLSLPLRHRGIICEPLLGPVELKAYLAGGRIESVVCGGESGPDARVCDYRWVLALREACRTTGTAFTFKQTGARFLKDGRLYEIPRRLQMAQAKRAQIDLNRRDALDGTGAL